ncbi:condensation domain-containing protein, partial [Bradyrhizobium sp. PRIMUS42]
QDLPFERLVQELQPAREASRHPIFQVLFALQNVPQEKFELPGLTLSKVGDQPVGGVDPSLYRLDLAFYLHEGDEGLHGFFQYATDLFDAATVKRLSEHLTQMLMEAVADADRPLSELAMLPE